MHIVNETTERTYVCKRDFWQVGDGGVEEKMNHVHLLVSPSSFVLWSGGLSNTFVCVCVCLRPRWGVTAAGPAAGIDR